MALIKSNEVPKDAVKLNEMEATTYMWDLMTNWEPTSDTWAIRYSVGVLGGISSACGLILNNHFRRKLKLGTYGHLSSLLPNTLLPGMFTAGFHRNWVTTDILLMKKETCPICYELRSAVVQIGFGIAYPMLLTPFSALMFANRYNTYRVPSMTKAPMELLMFTIKMTKPLSNTLIFLGAVNLVASSVMTYFEMQNHYTVRTKILHEESVDRRNNSF